MKEKFPQRRPDTMNINDTPLLQSEHIITQGEWAGGVPWQFIAVTQEADFPNISDCTAAFCVVTYKNKLVIVQHKTRGWELPGGHIDPDELINQTVEREVREEIGASISAPTYFGYKKVFPKVKVPHRDKPGQFYPYPHSYLPYFYGEAVELFDVPLADDVLAVQVVSLSEATALFSQGQNHHLIIQHLVNQGAIELK